MSREAGLETFSPQRPDPSRRSGGCGNSPRRIENCACRAGLGVQPMGSGVPICQAGVAWLPLSHVILLPLAIASLALLPVALRQRSWPNWMDAPRFLLAGLLAVPATCLVQFNGLALTTISRASLIIGVLPPVVGLASMVFLHDWGNRRYWLGVGVSALGISTMVGLPEDGGSWMGHSLVFISMLVSAAGFS
jgi:drug/metabolite transporter (DMT)-like permease